MRTEKKKSIGFNRRNGTRVGPSKVSDQYQKKDTTSLSLMQPFLGLHEKNDDKHRLQHS